jgi:hypothetical protein
MPNIVDSLERLSITLRVWAGCLAAAKAIADETLSGPNTTAVRVELFGWIDPSAATDALFRSGVEAAPAFKTLRGESYWLDGVPDASPVRRHV